MNDLILRIHELQSNDSSSSLIQRINGLPFEIQNKILYYTMIHPCSKIIKDLKKDYENINNKRINLNTKEYEPENFYECLCSMGFFSRESCGDDALDNFLQYIVEKMRNYQEVDEDELLFALSLL